MSPPKLVRRNSTINTTFNLCNDNTVVLNTIQCAVSHSNANEASIPMDSRELPEDYMEYSEEVRDLTETMRDVVSERGCAKTC